MKRKLIEVSLPLKAINKVLGFDKSDFEDIEW